MEEYRKTVELYAARHENYLFHNKGNEHALIIFENIFRNAKRKIRIVANNLCNKEVVDREEYIKPLIAFLDKGGVLHILLKNIPEKDNEELKSTKSLFRALYNHEAYVNNHVIIKSADGRCFHDKSRNEIHFCTADGLMYRLENNINERKAICNFGDEEKTVELDSLFDRAFDSIVNTVSLADFFGKEA